MRTMKPEDRTAGETAAKPWLTMMTKLAAAREAPMTNPPAGPLQGPPAATPQAARRP
jgi:hypothetical protein